MSSSRDCDDLSMDFPSSIDAREGEMTNKKTTEGICHVRSYLKDKFGFADHQDNCTYGLFHILTLQRNMVKLLLGHRVGANSAHNPVLAGRVIVEDKSLYAPRYTPNLSDQKIMLGHIVSRAATELWCLKKLLNESLIYWN